MIRYQRQQGMTLIELLVSLIMGLVITGGVTTVYLAIATNSMNTLDQMKLDQQVSTAMTMMSNDIRRAGYWGNQTTVEFQTPAANPFNQPDITAMEQPD